MQFDLAHDVTIPYLDQYFGAWAMHEPQFLRCAEQLRGIDLHVHMQSEAVQEAAAKATAAGAARAAARSTDAEGEIAIVSLRGVMMKQVGSATRGTSTVLARRQMRAAADDGNVSAIVLHIDSPGGTVAGTQDLAADVAAAAKRKPVVAFVEDLGASAAYWIASQATHVYANNTTALVGSIGTYGVVQDLSGAAAQQGVKVHVVRAGEFKGMGAAGTEVTAEQLGELQRVVDALNEQFLEAVANGRGMKRAQVDVLADGRVHPAAGAHALGLIDGVQSLDDTVQQLRNQHQKRGASAMSETTTTPQAATISELKQICADAPDGFDANAFVVAQGEKQASVSDAGSAYAKALEAFVVAQAASHEKQLDATRKETTAKQLGGQGTDGVTDGGGASATTAGDPIGDFEGAVEQKIAAGMRRDKAVQRVVREDPERHAAYIEAVNAPR